MRCPTVAAGDAASLPCIGARFHHVRRLVKLGSAGRLGRAAVHDRSVRAGNTKNQEDQKPSEIAEPESWIVTLKESEDDGVGNIGVAKKGWQQ